MERKDLTCEEARNILGRVVEGEVGSEVTGAGDGLLKRHLASCQACRRSFALDLAIIEAIKTLPDEVLESVAGEVMSRVTVRKRRLSLLRWGVVVSAVCAIGIAVNSFGPGVFEYILSLVSGQGGARPEIAALGRTGEILAGLAGSVASGVLGDVVAGSVSAYLSYILVLGTSGCLVVILMMYMMGLWLRKPGEVKS